MIERVFWKQKVTEALKRRPIVWLAGVRRVGKTTLVKSFPEARYFDCELPSVRSELADPEFFWSRHDGKLVILDEVHRLMDPSNVLKIASDHFKGVKVIATGSSTLAAKKKFKDTLTDRKQDVWLQPLLISELKAGKQLDLDKRFLFGGLPPAYLQDKLDNEFYREWLDSFWAKDIQELFAIDRKTSFLKLADLLLRQSGKLFQANSFAAPCEISRQTVQNYLDALETALFVHIVRPWHGGKSNEIVLMPKVYAFDTGFVCFALGRSELRQEDKGDLLEHLVLQELQAHFGKEAVFFWRDKQRHEIDFVVQPMRRREIHAVECKFSKEGFDPSAMNIFRKNVKAGKNILVAPNISRVSERRVGGLTILECPPWEISSAMF